MKELELNVKGMQCTGCENRIKNIIEKIDGVEKVEANYQTGKVRITSKKDIDLNEVKEKIEILDFEVCE